MPGRSSNKRVLKGEITLVSRDAFLVLAGITDTELTMWEQEELIMPVERPNSGAEPLYDLSALRRAKLIRTLAEELEVNLPGIGVILHLLELMER
jgi:DNA-binding transcriptional MerR regulator